MEDHAKHIVKPKIVKLWQKSTFQHKIVLNTVCNNKGDSQGRLHAKRVFEQKHG